MGEVGRECTKPCCRMHVLRSVAFNSLRDRRGSEVRQKYTQTYLEIHVLLNALTKLVCCKMLLTLMLK